MTVTDELLAELEEAASNATQDAWELLPGTSLSGPEIIANGESIAWVLDSEADAVHIATANPATITALTAELRRLRAEKAGLAKDAGRYRWLRDESLSCGKTAPAIMVVDEAGNPVYRGNPWNSLLCDDDADSAIDTAMADQ